MSWYPHTVTVAPASEPVSLSEAKAQTRVDGTANDTSLALYIAAARAHVEAYCGTPLVSRTVTVKCDIFDDFERFPLAPLSSVSSITYVDTASAPQTLSTDVYEVRSDGLIGSIVLKSGQSWPAIESGSRITLTATVGYAAVPDGIRLALLLLIGHWFEHREASDKPLESIPMGVDALLANWRIYAC